MENEKKLTRSSNRMIAGVCAGIFWMGPNFIKNRIRISHILHSFRWCNHLYYLVDCHALQNAFRRI